MELSPEKWPSVKALFEAALDAPAGDRSALLGVRCQDEKVRCEVERLLAEYQEATGFLSQPALTLLHPGSNGIVDHLANSMEFTETVFGRYHLQQKIGEGGMGEVWMAEQREPIRRRVALKVVKAGLKTREVIARFESERQALAMMDHPSIAKVFDAGSTPQGAPYFVMEYVAGIPITTFCDKHKLSTRQRLDLFARVCEGVQHAHQKAIIHRDLKPSNILVTEVDGRAVPKIIDFGVAKALSPKLTEATMFTRVGALVGTPEYMSPEQANSSLEDIDTRTDVYSLGIILYELLSGVPPIELRKVPFEEFLRRLREDEPPRLSTKIRTQSDATLADVARKRQTEPATLARQMRGDLDSIALKALEKDRSRRYGSPSELASDIGRYLRSEAVLAVRPSLVYRARKFTRRYRATVCAAAAFAVVFIVAGLISIRQTIRASRTAAELQRQLYIANVGLAAQAWKESDSQRAMELLKRVAPRSGERDLRGLEWYLLFNELRDSVPLASLNVQGGGIIGISPDGTRLYAVEGGAIVTLDARTGRILERLLTNPQGLKGMVRMSADDTRIYTVDRDGIIAIDTATGSFSRLLLIRNALDLAFQPSSDGRFLAVTSPHSIRILDLRTMAASGGPWPYDRSSSAAARQDSLVFDDAIAMFWSDDSLLTSDGEQVFVSRAPEWKPTFLHRAMHPLRCLTGSQDGQSVALTMRNSIEVWSADFSRKLTSIQTDQSGCAVFSGDGNYLSWGEYGPIRILDLRTLRVTNLSGHYGFPSGIFSPDSTLLASVAQDAVRVWDVQSGRQLFSPGRYAGGASLAFSPDSRRLIVYGNSGRLDIWDLQKQRPRMMTRDEIYSIAFSEDGNRFVSGGNAGEVTLWRSASGTKLRDYQVGERVEGLEFVDEDMLLLSTVHEVALWNLVTGRREVTLGDSSRRVIAALAPDRKTVAVADVATRELTVLDLRTQQIRSRISVDAAPISVAFAPDNRTLAVGLLDNQVQVFDPNGSRKLPGPGWPRVLVFSPDGGRLITGYDSSQIYVWNWRRQQTVTVMGDHGGAIKSIRFSPDGARLVSTSDDGTVRIWDAATYAAMAVFRESERSVETAAFSPDSRYLAIAGDDRRIRLWAALRESGSLR